LFILTFTSSICVCFYCIYPLSQPCFHSSYYLHLLLFKIILFKLIFHIFLFFPLLYNWLIWYSVWMSYHVECFWNVTPVFWCVRVPYFVHLLLSAVVVIYSTVMPHMATDSTSVNNERRKLPRKCLLVKWLFAVDTKEKF